MLLATVNRITQSKGILQNVSFIGSSIVYQLTNFLTLFILSNRLENTIFAKFIILQNLSAVFGILVTMGINPNVISLLLQKFDKQIIWSSYFLMILTHFGILTILFYGANAFVSAVEINAFILGFYFFSILENALGYLAIADLKMKTIWLISICRIIILPSTLLIFIHSNSLNGVLFSYIVTGVIITTIYSLQLGIKPTRSSSFSFFYKKNVLAINAPFFISNISTSVSEYLLNRLLFSFTIGAQIIRVNTVMKQLVNLLLFVPNKTMAIMVPQVFSGASVRSSKIFVYTGGMYLVGGVVFFTFKNIIYHYYKLPELPLIDWIAVTFFMWGFFSIGNQYLGNMLILKNKAIVRNVADVLLGAVNLFIFWLLTTHIPELAYAGSSLISFIAINIFLFFFLKKK